MSEIQNLTIDYFIYEFDKSTNGINAQKLYCMQV